MKIRDFLSLPFLFLSVILEGIAIKIGGVWTAEMILDSYRKLSKLLNNTPSGEKGRE